MPLSPVDSAAVKIDANIFSTYPLLEGSDTVRHYVTGRIAEWKVATRSLLDTAFPLSAHEQKLLEWQSRLRASPALQSELGKAVEEYILFCKEAGHPANETFWKSQFTTRTQKTAIAQKFSDDSSISTRLFLAEWQKRIDQTRAEWELREIESRRAALMEQFEQLLRLLQDLQKRLCPLGLDTGILLDFSKGDLKPQDIQQLERWAKYLAEDKGVKALCDFLGKMRQIELSERIERVKSAARVNIRLPDINSQEEIVGVRFGRDIEHVLPSELALLADPDTALLFDLKYVESSLMCFDMQGIQDTHQYVEKEDDRSVKDTEKYGPMIICVDTSGSMNGTPETIAKAVALFLAAKAREQQRPCYLINFSTEITTLDLSAHVGMTAVLRFLQMSFHGGTDVAPALEHALETMEQDSYKNSDLLIVSDFIMSELPKSLLERIENRRLDGNRFHSLVVGSCYMTKHLKTLFDNEWIYDPRSGYIQELLSFERNMR